MAESVDRESAEWLRDLTGGQREAAQARLHAELLRIARGEVRRRAERLRVSGPELDDLTHQAAADALLAIIAKLAQFRGDSRFATWAYKFVIFEVSTKLGRHFWRNPTVSLEAEEWDRLPHRYGFDPAQETESREFVTAVRRAVDNELTERQRRIFVAIVVNGVPLDALVVELSTNRKTRVMSAVPRRCGCCTSTPTWSPKAPTRRSATPASPHICARAALARKTSTDCWPRYAKPLDRVPAALTSGAAMHRALPAG